MTVAWRGSAARKLAVSRRTMSNRRDIAGNCDPDTHATQWDWLRSVTDEGDKSRPLPLGASPERFLIEFVRLRFAAEGSVTAIIFESPSGDMLGHCLVLSTLNCRPFIEGTIDQARSNQSQTRAGCSPMSGLADGRTRS